MSFAGAFMSTASVGATGCHRELRLDSAAGQRGVSAPADRHCMPRRQRQRNELRDLCRSGAVARAIDLAFEHFAQFGRDDDIIEQLAEAVEQAEAPASVRRRFAELRASHHGGSSGVGR